MGLINFVHRQKEMLRIFRMGKETALEPTGVDIRFDSFDSAFNFQNVLAFSRSALEDGAIGENQRFIYPIFVPRKGRMHRAIVLLHGLNERSWDKYLCWAEYLASQTGRPVILFPIAYHMNRSPAFWSNPRSMSLLVRHRQERVGTDPSLCFANVALSERLFEDPARFYTSGRQTLDDLQVLATKLKQGEHPLFPKGTTVDFFAYSIGAFLAEITLMANPDNLFDASKLFVFCGGSIFESMYGESRFIMDKPAYNRLFQFFINEWRGLERSPEGKDATKIAFDAMIVPEADRDRREGFFKSLGNRIAGIALKKDTVMPFEGVEACMGSHTAGTKFQLLDFPYEYTHESPFPMNAHIDPEVLNRSFDRVFDSAARFLA
jgi:hypothetical protein